MLDVSRPGAVERLATVSVAAIDGGSFFVEGLEDPPDEVEDWLTAANSFFAEKSRLSLADALEALLAKAPRSLGAPPVAAGEDGCHSRSGKIRKRDEEQDDEMDEPDLLVEDDDDDDQGIAIETIEAAEDRSQQRAAYNENQKWDSMVTASAPMGSRQASQVLMREMRNLMALRGEGDRKALEIDMVDDSLYRWVVKMHAEGFPEDCALRRELAKFASQHPSGLAAVVMDVHFPDSYPMEPPFIRVVRPRFLMHTGHITIGGSVCMQLLTASGWLPSVSLENVFVSIRSEMIEGGGRLDLPNSGRDYTMADAQEAFKRVASRYGWIKT